MKGEPCVAYIMSRFPNLTETFVVYEIVSLERQGIRVEVFPLLRTPQDVVQPEAEDIIQRAHYHPFLSLRILAANLYFLKRSPANYFKTLWEILRGTWGSANFFIGAIGIFPKSVRFAYEMEQQGVTHVHAHFANHPTVAALIIHRLIGIPFSFTAHGHDIHVERRMLAHKIEASSFAVTISAYNKKLMLEECENMNPEKVRVIHCGTDLEVFAPRESSERDSRFTIICIGSLLEVKGHRYLVEACARLKVKGLDLLVHLVGQGSLLGVLKDQVNKAGLQENFRFNGPLPRPRVIELLAASDVIVQSSVHTARGAREGIPVSLMEGMASGLPVVASGISGIPELVENDVSGFLVPPRDSFALADALERLHGQPELRRKMGLAGRERVRRDFNLHRNAATLIEMFKQAGESS